MLGPWPLKITTDGHSLSVALTADTGRDFCTVPSPQCVCAHTAQMGAHLASLAQADLLLFGPEVPSTYPLPSPSQRGARLAGRAHYLQEVDPKGPDLFTMCPVAFDGNSIAPFILSQRPGWGKERD